MPDKSTEQRFTKAKRELFDKLYDNLNERQREAVFSVNGPLLILAGAGSGKTTVLVNRIAFMIKYGNAYFGDNVPEDVTEEEIAGLVSAKNLGKEEIAEVLSEYTCDQCPPWSILSITFTNKAANEMKERLSRTIGEYAKDINAGTFHSICLRILRRYGDKLGYESGFTIYDTDDSKRLILSCMRELNIDDKGLPVKEVQSKISRMKDRLTTPAECARSVGSDFKLSQISAVYSLYQKKLMDANAVDFDDIIMQTVRLLTDFDDVRDYYSRRFKYVCVDEYQDTNYAQFELVRLLSGFHRNLMVVGDDDQSIYKFRGATIENILNFDRTFKDAKIIKLEENYRSTASILEAANAVIKNNVGRRGKELWTAREGGEKIKLAKLDNQNDEAKFIVNKIMELVIKEKRKYGDFAILYRMNAQSNSLEQVLARSGISYRIIGGMRFYERKEIKDIISYLCVVNNPSDNLRLKRIINEPKRKIGDMTVSAVENIAAMNNVSMFEVMREADRYPALVKQASKLKEFAALIENLREISQTESLPVLFEKTMDLSGYRQMLVLAGEAEADRLENIRELLSNAVEYQKNHEDPSLSNFLEEVALVSDIDNYDENGDAVVLMTIHSAKGLEFPVVFLPGFEEGIFPGMQSAMFPEELEEERRLAYVAITRAKDKLYITHVKERLFFGRTQYNRLSRFVTEIPEKCIENEETAGKKEMRPAPQKRSKPTVSREFFARAAVSSGMGRSVGYDRFSAGDRVSHVTFGRGTVLSAVTMGADVLYEIAFDTVGTKKLMATYARLKRVE